jgi:hypothetical protein
MAIKAVHEDGLRSLELKEEEFLEEARKIEQMAMDHEENEIRKKDLEIDRIVTKNEKELQVVLAREEKRREELKISTVEEEKVKWTGVLIDKENELLAKSNFEMNKIRASHDSELHQTISKAQENMRHKVDELEKFHAAALEAAESNHANEIVQLRDQCFDEKVEALRLLRKECEDKLSDLRLHTHEIAEERIRELRAEWAQEMEEKIEMHNQNNAELLEKKMVRIINKKILCIILFNMIVHVHIVG